MIIIFNGDTLQLKDCLKRFSGATEKVTLDFMLENFKMLDIEFIPSLINETKGARKESPRGFAIPVDDAVKGI